MEGKPDDPGNRVATRFLALLLILGYLIPGYSDSGRFIVRGIVVLWIQEVR
jgi:hypothetical protein